MITEVITQGVCGEAAAGALFRRSLVAPVIRYSGPPYAWAGRSAFKDSLPKIPEPCCDRYFLHSAERAGRFLTRVTSRLQPSFFLVNPPPGIEVCISYDYLFPGSAPG